MRESLRLRLVLWYGLALAFVVVAHGGAVAYQSWRSVVAALDAELRFHAEALAAALEPVDASHFDLALTGTSVEYFRREPGRPYYAIWGRTGALVDQSQPDLDVPVPDRPHARTVDGRREVAIDAPGGARIVVGRTLTPLWQVQRGLLINVGLAGAAALLAAVWAAWFLAGRALAPVARISAAARAMSAGDLAARIPVERTETELEQVASSLNEAFDRLRLALDQQRRFTADASHELRTPIAVLRAEADWALDRQRTPEEYHRSLVVCRRAASRMQEAVTQLLAMARAEAPAPARLPIDVRVLVDDVLTWLRPLAAARAVTLTSHLEPATILGDNMPLREALGNIVGNAIRYNRPGGEVIVSSRADGPDAVIEVADTGIGIPAAALPHVFDRFFRVDDARAHDGGGAGLGLSVARAIVDAHGGTIACSSEPGAGSRFVVSLPRRAGAPGAGKGRRADRTGATVPPC